MASDSDKVLKKLMKLMKNTDIVFTLFTLLGGEQPKVCT